VEAFSEQVGPENSYKKVPGCYYIYSPNHPELGTYVGHSIHLGKRVKDHAPALLENLRFYRVYKLIQEN